MRTLLAGLLCAAALFAAEPGQRAPGFALMDSRGEIVDLYDFRGKPVILEFMNTGCPHCAQFAGVLEKVQAKYGDKVGIIAVANPPDNPNTVGKFAAGHGIKYPILFDAGQAAYSYVRTMKFDLPQVYLIDANGIIFNKYSYSVLTKNIFEGDGLIGEVERLLASSRPKAPAAKSAPKKK
jgi:peroxiredoxin